MSTAPYRYQGRFTVHAPAARIAEQMSPSAATVEPLDARSCSVTAGSDSLDELALWVALLDAPFEVHGPPELTERLRTLAERLADAANGSTRGKDAEGARDMEGAGGVRE